MPTDTEGGSRHIMDRWPLSAFGDEIAVDLEAQVNTLCAEGVRHLDLRSAWGVNVVNLGPEALDRAARVLREACVGVSAIGSPVGKAPIEGDFDVELARLRAALEAAHRLDARLVRVFSFFVEGRYAEHRDEVLRRMAALAGEAETAGVTLVHENESHIYGDVTDRCRDLVESVASPALRLAFDPANFVQCDVRPHTEAWPQLARHVAHFHVKDAVAVDRGDGPPYPTPAPEGSLMASVRLPGEGDGQLRELLGELARSGYRGFLTVEPHLAWRMPDLSGAERFSAAVGALRQLVAEVR